MLICSACGTRFAVGHQYCPVCGKRVVASAVMDVADDSPELLAPPVTSGRAIASLICGILFVFPLSVIAIVFGHFSLAEIGSSAGRLKGRGLAMAGLVLGYVGFVVFVLVVIVGVISLPKAWRKQQADAARSSPVSVVRALNTAEIAYSQAHPAAGYTCSFSELWGVSNSVALAKKNGYALDLAQCSRDKSGGPVVKYQLVVHPMAQKTARPTYCSSESDVIKIARNGSAQDCVTAGVELSENEINRPPDW